MRLILIRHGQTPSNVLGALDTGRPGPGLTPLGTTQAGAIPDHLPRLTASGDLTEVDGLYVSPLIRTSLTAAPLARTLALGPQEVPGLEEISAGDLEMRTDAAAVHAYREALARWSASDLAHRMPGGHDGHAFLERFDTAVERLASAHGDATVVAVSHGAAIRLWSALQASNVAAVEAVAVSLHNTGACVMEGDPERGWQRTAWHGDPLGGAGLEDEQAHDVTADADEGSTAGR